MSTSSSSIGSSGSQSPERRSARIRGTIRRHPEDDETTDSSPIRRGRGRSGRGGIRGRGGARGRGIGRGRGRGHAAGEVPPNRADEALQIIQTRQSRMKAKVELMEVEKLQDLVVQMINVHPGLVFNIMEPAEQQPGGYHPGPDGDTPDWCVCTKCRQMPTDPEKVCCERKDCISLLPFKGLLQINQAITTRLQHCEIAYETLQHENRIMQEKLLQMGINVRDLVTKQTMNGALRSPSGSPPQRSPSEAGLSPRHRMLLGPHTLHGKSLESGSMKAEQDT